MPETELATVKLEPGCVANQNQDGGTIVGESRRAESVLCPVRQELLSIDNDGMDQNLVWNGFNILL